MGVTVECKKTGRSFDMGYGGFFRWRLKIAELCDPKWGAHYRHIDDAPFLDINDARKKFFEEYDKETLRLINEEKVSVKLVDFCLQPDCEGSINYGACKLILKGIGDYTDELAYGYAAFADHDWDKLKAILQDCAENKSKLVWR